jgi:hypothetical protein
MAKSAHRATGRADVRESEAEELVVAFWGIACMVIGGVIGWQLHGIFQ